MRNFKKYDIWIQPGGHIELNEDPLQALVHELEEETGLHESDYRVIELNDQPTLRKTKTLPQPININVHDVNDTHKHIDMCFLVQSSSDRFNPSEGESTETGWFSLDDITDMQKEGKVYDGTLDICAWVLEKTQK